MDLQVFKIAGKKHQAKNAKQAAKLCAISDMAQSNENWKVLNPSMINSISIYTRIAMPII